MPLKQAFSQKIKPLRDEIKALLAEHGDKPIGQVTLSMAYGGMRDIKALVTETSALDPEEGIRFRGYTVEELRAGLPRVPGGIEPLPEGILYLLFTGDMPTHDDVNELIRDLRSREALPPHCTQAIDAVPPDTLPMTQFIVGILALQTESIFAQAYQELPKNQLWEPCYEDSLNLIAKLPLIAAYIYRRSFKNGEHIPPAPPDLDWAGNFAHMLGHDSFQVRALMRLYMCLHSDHEGGNVSAHAVHLTGSALSDPYLCFAAGMCGLAGPLHGLANQEVLRWIIDMKKALGEGTPTREAIERYVWDTLDSGHVVPGFGHAVLRKTDPRYMAQRDFALKHLPDDPLFHLVSTLYEVVPEILRKHGKAKNPWPNVDAHSGVLLAHFGITEYTYYTVLFGVSRALGTLASLCWDRALGMPLERPKSITTEWVKSFVRNGAQPASSAA